MASKDQAAAPSFRQVDDAWQVHRALLIAETRNPELKENPQWKLHRMDAYEDFYGMLERYTDVR